MSPTFSYLVAVMYLALGFFPLVLGARAITRVLVPQWTGSLHWLATATLVAGAVLPVAQLLGSIGLFRRGPLTVSLALLGFGLRYVAHRRSERHDGGGSGSLPDATGPRQRDRLVVLAAIPLLAATWGAITVETLRHGVYSGDSIWYHLPVAARFAQDGSTAHLHYLDPSNVIAFYPESSELLHGVGMLYLGNDLLTPALTLVWLIVALLSAWSIGRPHGVAPAALVSVSMIMVSPLLVASQPGAAQNDVTGIALLLAATAFLLTGARSSRKFDPSVHLYAAVAAGLALGTKLTFIVPAVCLFAAASISSPRHQRIRCVATWVPVFAVTGGYWYVRNWIAVGSPIPNLRVSVAGLSLRSVTPRAPADSLVEYLFDWHIWRRSLVPALSAKYGSLWWLGVLLALTGLVLAVAGTCRVRRWLGLAGIVMLAGYLMSPQGLHVSGEDFAYFGFNTRFAIPGIALGLVLLPLSPAVASPLRYRLTMCLFGAVVIAGLPQALHIVAPLDAWILGGAAFAVCAAVCFTRASDGLGRFRYLFGALVALAVIVGGFPLQQTYLQNRYARRTPFLRLLGISSASQWARDVEGTRIGIVGSVLQYPFYGTELSNHVQYVGKLSPNGSFDRFPDCSSWREAVDRGRYEYLVIGRSYSGGTAPEETWTVGGTDVSLVLRDDAVSVFRIPPAGLSGDGCP